MRRLETTGLDDQDHLAVIGALTPGARILQGLQLAQPGWMQPSFPQGVSTPSEELDYLPLSIVDFTNTGGAGVDHQDELSALPQRPFRGERIVLTAIYFAVGGAVGDGLYRVLISPAVYVGAVQVGATQGDMPAAAFSATAFGVRLSMPSAGQGTRIYIPFHVPGVAPGDRIVVAGGIFGRAVR